MTRSRELPCPECSKKFKTNSGLRWHLYHRHGWQDVQELLGMPSPAKLAKAALLKEMEMEAFAMGANVEVGYLKQLMEKYFGKDAD